MSAVIALTEAHGTRRHYKAGCHCVPCRAAEAAYRARLRQLHARDRQPLGTVVSASETWKRIRSLRAEHLTDSEISRRLGLRRRGLRVATDRVTLITALKVRRLCRSLLMDERAA